jgi:hypothetical protein
LLILIPLTRNFHGNVWLILWVAEREDMSISTLYNVAITTNTVAHFLTFVL